jgi:hypothetical protein
MPHDFYPRNYYYSYATATTHPPPKPQQKPCDFWDIVCKAGQAGKFITDSVLGESNAIQQGAGGISHDVQTRVGKGVDRTKKDIHNVKKAVGGAGKTVVDSTLGESHAIQQGAGDALKSTGNFLGGGTFGGIPITLIAIGGGALILLLILLKRR